jgi:TRAP-type C4-dicarboxylate transport system permease small subunit
MRRVERVIDAIAYITGYFSGWVVIGIMSLTMAEVITRYVLRHPLMLADEFGGYAYAAVSLVALAYTMRQGRHIRVQFVVSRLPATVSNWLRVITLTLALVYACVATQASYTFIVQAFQRNIRSASWLMTPWAWPQMIFPIGFSLLCLILLVEIAQAIRNIRSGVSTEAIAAKKAEEGSI